MATKTKTTVVVPEIRIGKVQIHLKSESLLCTHRFSEKAIKAILDKQMGIPSQGREAKDTVRDFLSGLYILPGSDEVKVHGEWPSEIWAEGGFGFPAMSLKLAIIRAATDCNLHMTDMRRALRIPSADGLIPIICKPGPYLRSDPVRLSSGVCDIRFRPEFREWQADVIIRFNMAILNIDQLLTLVNSAGFGAGIGQGRPSLSGGEWGTFRLDRERQIDVEEERW